MNQENGVNLQRESGGKSPRILVEVYHIYGGNVSVWSS